MIEGDFADRKISAHVDWGRARAEGPSKVRATSGAT